MILEIDAGNTRAKWRLRYTSTQGLSGVLLEYGAVDIMCDAEKAALELKIMEKEHGFREGHAEALNPQGE